MDIRTKSAQLSKFPEVVMNCPHCGATPFRSALRGMVGDGDYQTACICRECKEIVAYEVFPYKSVAYFFA